MSLYRGYFVITYIDPYGGRVLSQQEQDPLPPPPTPPPGVGGKPNQPRPGETWQVKHGVKHGATGETWGNMGGNMVGGNMGPPI